MRFVDDDDNELLRDGRRLHARACELARESLDLRREADLLIALEYLGDDGALLERAVVVYGGSQCNTTWRGHSTYQAWLADDSDDSEAIDD